MKNQNEIFDTPEELRELESELALLKPVRLQKTQLNRPEKKPARWFSHRQILTHSIGILIGVAFGAAAVHYLQKPLVVETVRYVEVQSKPVAVEPPKKTERIREPVPFNQRQLFLDIDAVIASYNQRAKQFAHITVAPRSYSASSAESGSDPDSLLQLRNRYLN